MTEVFLRSVSKTYRGHPAALRDVDLDVPDGTILALLGPSGSGKTTLLRLVAGFERADSGEISLGPRIVDSVGHLVPPEHRHIGYVPQEGALFPHLSVAANIGFGLRDRKGRAARVDEMLDLVGLRGHAGKFPHELSGGQQQRVALARALGPSPGVILLDEPFNALDLDLRRRMSEEVIGLLRHAGTTAILVTHDPSEAFAVADRVAVMKDGSVMQSGTPAEVYGAPVNLDVARLTGETVIIEGISRGDAVETPLGLIALHGNPATEGALVRVLLRPEQLHIAPEKKEPAATVRECRFRGDHIVVTLDIGGLLLRVRAHERPPGRFVSLRVEGRARIISSEAKPHPHGAATVAGVAELSPRIGRSIRPAAEAG
jgi:iron(III) transport system ATP-binding protein